CCLSKECVARFTRCSFDRHLLFLPKRTDVYRSDFKFNAAGRCTPSASLARPRAWQAERLLYKFLVAALDQPFHKPRIGIARSSAQAMIKMANGQVFVAQTNKPVQEGYGITPTGHADQIARIWGN